MVSLLLHAFQNPSARIQLPRTQFRAAAHLQSAPAAAAAAALHAAAGSGTISVKELQAALTTMGQTPTDEELFVLIHDVRAQHRCSA